MSQPSDLRRLLDEANRRADWTTPELDTFLRNHAEELLALWKAAGYCADDRAHEQPIDLNYAAVLKDHIENLQAALARLEAK